MQKENFGYYNYAGGFQSNYHGNFDGRGSCVGGSFPLKKFLVLMVLMEDVIV